jgi:hypothetical protein
MDEPYRGGPSRKKPEEEIRSIETILVIAGTVNAVRYLTPPMKFRATKLAAKLSIRCQLRCNC